MKNITLLIIAVLTSFVGFNQDLTADTNELDSLSNVKDSLNDVQLIEFNKKLAAIEFQYVQDSLKRMELEQQLSSLQTTDNIKKEELLQELEALNTEKEKRLSDKKMQIDAMRLTLNGFPVIGFFNDTLFMIYSKLGSFSPKDRAIAIGSRINILADQISDKDSLTVVEVEGAFDVMYKEQIIVSVSENDGIWNNKPLKLLAEEYAVIIRAAIDQYHAETSTMTILKRVGLVAIVLIVLIAALFWTGRLFNWTTKKIEAEEGKKLKGIKIKNYTFFDAKREVNAVLFVNKIVKWLFYIVLLYIAIPILFGIFPWTRDFAETLFGYILNPIKNIGMGFFNYLPNLITIIVIIFIFRYVIKGISFLKSEVENGNLVLAGFYPDWANPTYQIIRVLLFAFMIVVIFPYLPGSDSPVFQGVSVLLGFLLTFGSAGSLSNIVAGVVLTYMRLFTIGDRVKIGEVFGDVVEKSLLVTRVRTTKNEIISIPNSNVMSSHTINYSSDAPAKGLIIHSTVTIGYDVPWKKMHETLLEAAKRTELILDTPEPFVLQTSLDDFYVSYEINGYTKVPNMQARIYSDLHQNIQDVCFENGIEILSPHYRAGRDGNATTIPADYLDKDYKAPSFNVKVEK
ncbi:mechanosensitive ion channel family protein [Crocinitomix catalasitica]|uniref:mechanosensitive ion channel family protein n=1 Tax=Crocinitomix catalasitica TaxID=184607 RepID=UPI0004817FD0|nr:mechanosensitive ion channel family protein [Crocinitomix catalasitica]